MCTDQNVVNWPSLNHFTFPQTRIKGKVLQPVKILEMSKICALCIHKTTIGTIVEYEFLKSSLQHRRHSRCFSCYSFRLLITATKTSISSPRGQNLALSRKCVNFLEKKI